MRNPYLVGCLAYFANDQDEEGVFEVSDQYCSLQQLYLVNDLYRREISINSELSEIVNHETNDSVYSKVVFDTCNKFKCACGAYFQDLAPVPFENESDNWKYLSGLFDMSSTLEIRNNDLSLRLFSSSSDFLKHVQTFIKIPSRLSDSFLEYQSTNVIDLFGHLPDSFKRYDLNQLIQERVLPVCRVIQKDPQAVMPFKSRLSDVGYDLTVIRKHKDLTSNTALYDTGIAIEIPFKYYAEIVPRSSLSKSGYILSNSIGIIDPGYKGNLYIALTKVSPEVGEISFPFRCGQLIFKRQVYVSLLEAKMTSKSTRGDGGYGSTDSLNNQVKIKIV